MTPKLLEAPPVLLPVIPQIERNKSKKVPPAVTWESLCHFSSACSMQGSRRYGQAPGNPPEHLRSQTLKVMAACFYFQDDLEMQASIYAKGSDLGAF